MLEQIFYWTGGLFLISVSLISGMILIWSSALFVKRWIIKDLKSTYHHVQLKYFMSQIKRKGYKLTIEDYDKTHMS